MGPYLKLAMYCIPWDVVQPHQDGSPNRIQWQQFQASWAFPCGLSHSNAYKVGPGTSYKKGYHPKLPIYKAVYRHRGFNPFITGRGPPLHTSVESFTFVATIFATLH